MIVIVGAEGRSGRIVAAELKRRGCEIRRLVRQREALDARVVDVRDAAAVDRAFDGATAAYVVLPDNLGAESFHEERRRMADNIVGAVRRASFSRIVFVSATTAALGERREAGFGADLAYVERRLFETNAAVTVLRAAYFQDNVLGALPFARRDGVYPSLFSSSSLSVDTVAAADVGRAAARFLLEQPRAQHEVVDLVGHAYSAHEIAAVLGRTVGRDVGVLDLPNGKREALLRAWMPSEAASAMLATLDALAGGSALLRGDYRLSAPTRLEQTLASVVEHAEVAR